MTRAPKAAQPSTAAPVPPRSALLRILKGKWEAQAVSTAAQLGLADHLATNGPLDAGELATRAGCHAPSLYRLLRALASLGALEEDAHGRFALTAVGAELRSGKLREIAAFVGSSAGWDPWSTLPAAVRSGTGAFQQTFGTDFYSFMREHPEQAQRFDEAMEAMSANVARSLSEAVELEGVRTLVDVGGGRGTLLSHLLERWPDIRGVLFDMPHVIERTRPLIEAGPHGRRLSLIGGNFFDAVPRGGDVYVLMHVLHNWDDEHATQILASCRDAMAPGGRVCVVDAVIAPGNVPDVSKLLDLEMLVLTCSGRERTKNEVRGLLRASGLRLARSTTLDGPERLLEAVRA